MSNRPHRKTSGYSGGAFLFYQSNFVLLHPQL